MVSEILVLLFGLSCGSFCACLVSRIVNFKPLFSLRSYCFSCQARLKILDLIPVFSYLFLKRCRYCLCKLSRQDFCIEILGVLLSFLAFFKSENLHTFLLFSLFLYVFLILAFVDFSLLAVPSWLLWVFFGLSFLNLDLSLFQVELFFINSFCFAGFLFLLKSLVLFVKNFKSKKLEENLGDADIILFSALSGLFGFVDAFWILFVSSVLFIIVFLFKKTRKQAFISFAFVSFLLYLGYGMFL